MTPADEGIWVLRAQCGDRGALESLLRSVQPSLHRYVRRLAGSDRGDDIVHDVLITIARKLAWLSEPRVFRAWAFRIASRAVFRQLRKHRRGGSEESSDALLDGLPAIEPPPAGERLRELLDTDALSPASRAVLLLHFEEEMELSEVAAVLEIPLGTVKSRLAYD